MQKVKIALFGYGTTGRMVANELLMDSELELCWVARKNKEDSDSRFKIVAIDELTQKFIKANPVDLIIDFSLSSGVNDYYELAKTGVRVVSAISKYDPADKEKLASLGDYTSVLYSPNITLGINLLIVAASAIKKVIPEADIAIVEEHFSAKNEVSGTAKKIAEILEVQEANNIHSIRAGGIVGKHEVIFGLNNQTLRIIHESINKSSFGQGAIFAAKWLINKPKGNYTMEDIMQERLNQELGSRRINQASKFQALMNKLSKFWTK